MMKTIKLDITQQNIFFISDTHFHHSNIVKYCDRPFGHVKTMDSAMIQNWNRVVGEKDIVIIGGDFCWGQKESWIWLLHTLNGRKYLTPGNHDKHNMIPYDLFEKVDLFMNFMILGDEEIPEGQRITVCHYPMVSWYQSHRGAWQVYGHVHGGLSNKGDMRVSANQLDAGVDVHNFTPISYDEVKTIITKQNLR